MWLLFTSKSGTKVVKDGKTFVEECPTCQQRTRFVEVEMTAKYGVFFVDVLGDSERGFKCTKCGDVFDLRDQEEAAPTREPERTREAAPARPQKPAVTEEDRARVAQKIDDELAELKRRMGRS